MAGVPTGDSLSADEYSTRLNVNIGYGWFAPGGGLLTPYSEITLGAQARNYRLGIRWNPSSPFSLHLVGERKESSGCIDTHNVLLGSRI